MLNLDKAEKIKMTIRPHWLLFAGELVFLAIMAVLPVVLYFTTGLFARFNLETAASEPILLSMYALWLVGCWTFLLMIWTDYYLDMWIITDGRIIDVSQAGLIKRQVTSLPLDKITDVVTDGKRVVLYVPDEKKRYSLPPVSDSQAVRDLVIREQRNTLDRLKKAFTILEEPAA